MELGFTRKDGSTAEFYFMVTATIGTVILGMLTDRLKKAYVILLMYGGILAGLLALNGASSLEQMYMAAALAGAFVIGCQGVLYAFGSIVYPTEVRGTGVGVASAVGRIGAMLGPAIAGQLLTAGLRCSRGDLGSDSMYRNLCGMYATPGQPYQGLKIKR